MKYRQKSDAWRLRWKSNDESRYPERLRVRASDQHRNVSQNFAVVSFYRRAALIRMSSLRRTSSASTTRAHSFEIGVQADAFLGQGLPAPPLPGASPCLTRRPSRPPEAASSSFRTHYFAARRLSARPDDSIHRPRPRPARRRKLSAPAPPAQTTGAGDKRSSTKSASQTVGSIGIGPGHPVPAMRRQEQTVSRTELAILRLACNRQPRSRRSRAEPIRPHPGRTRSPPAKPGHARQCVPGESRFFQERIDRFIGAQDRQRRQNIRRRRSGIGILGHHNRNPAVRNLFLGDTAKQGETPCD